MVAIFAVFATLSMQDMKQMGVGLAVAVLLDATVVRAMLLPSVMAVRGRPSVGRVDQSGVIGASGFRAGEWPVPSACCAFWHTGMRCGTGSHLRTPAMTRRPPEARRSSEA
jgi:hypothetical protein